MGINPSVADDVWAFDDNFRRLSGFLFQSTDDASVAERRRKYRMALLHIFDGLIWENPGEIGVGGTMLYQQFRGMDRPDYSLDVVSDEDLRQEDLFSGHC